MSVSRRESETIRNYLLGQLTALEREEFEHRYFSDDALFKELQVAEDDLIDDFLTGDLSEEDVVMFHQEFLVGSERKQKLRIGRAWRKYASTHGGETPSKKNQSEWASRWAHLFAVPTFRIAALAAVLLIAAVGVWRIFFFQSDVDRGLLALNAAYQQQRPLESRITKLTYAPFVTTRGPGADNVNPDDLRRAELTLLDAVDKNPTRAAYHALGKLYLSQKNFDQATSWFERALEGDSDNPQIHADLGAAFLERGRAERANHPDKSPANFARSLQHLNRALGLNESMLEARFNRALLYRDMMLPRQAEDDWKKYLEKDPSSPWATEARRNLQLLSQKSAGQATPVELLNDFISAFQSRDEERAWQVLSSNKEMISGKFIPQQLVKAFLKESSEARPGQAMKSLEALVYAGELEIKKSGDPYISDLAAFYTRASPEQRDLLGRAQQSVIVAYSLCEKARFDEAQGEFIKAKQLFERAGNEWESRLLDYWVAYCLNQEDKIRESTDLLGSLAEYCQRNNYKWLSGHANCWLGINYAELDDHSSSIRYFERSLAAVEEIQDNYNHQKVLSQLATQYTQVGQPERALIYNWRSLRLAASAYPGARQTWRNYLYIGRTLIAMNLYDAAAAFGDEMLHVALNDVKQDDIIQYSYDYLGQLYSGLGRYEEAMRLTALSIGIAQSLQGKSAARRQSAYSLLQLAHIRRQAGHHAEALNDYDQVIQSFDQMELEAFKYDALKGRLLSQVALNNDFEIETQLPVVLKQFEEYRLKIREELSLHSFFDREHDVYDIAINHSYNKGDTLRALEYSETSRARSLLATLRNGAPGAQAYPRGDSLSSSGTPPMGLAALRMLMPNNVQVVQYAVLKDRTLIWLITRESVLTGISDIPEAELQAKILNYANEIRKAPSGPREDLKTLAKELYDTLIDPVAKRLDPGKVVCIIPDKAISLVPFSALVSSRSGQYLISELSLISAPSFNVFISCSEAARGKVKQRIETLTSIGNPSFSREDFPGLADLPAAATEAKGIAKYYVTREFIGPNALRDRIQPELPGADVIHFAGHYLANDRDPMSSRIVLAKRRGATGADDGSLSAGEIDGRKLPRTKLIVLSACQTGVGKYYNGEGVISISRTFLGTGIPLVVASQWAVDSEATCELMLKFHRYRSHEGGLSTVAALRKAQFEMLDQEGGVYNDPYYWAGFLTMGGFADF